MGCPQGRWGPGPWGCQRDKGLGARDRGGAGDAGGGKDTGWHWDWGCGGGTGDWGCGGGSGDWVCGGGSGNGFVGWHRGSRGLPVPGAVPRGQTAPGQGGPPRPSVSPQPPAPCGPACSSPWPCWARPLPATWVSAPGEPQEPAGPSEVAKPEELELEPESELEAEAEAEECPLEAETEALNITEPQSARTFRYIIVRRCQNFHTAAVCSRCYRGRLASIHSYRTNVLLQCRARARVNNGRVWIGAITRPVVRGCGHLSALGSPLWGGPARGGWGAAGYGRWRSTRCRVRLPFICEY
uniref:Uncharacterized protein n=1 Tax=Anas platyrhynchos TaxID=8839 RepID=A0A8B9TFS6_ANAPL